MTEPIGKCGWCGEDVTSQSVSPGDVDSWQGYEQIVSVAVTNEPCGHTRMTQGSAAEALE